MTDQRSILDPSILVYFVPIEAGRKKKVTGIGGTTVDVRGTGDVNVISKVNGEALRGICTSWQTHNHIKNIMTT